MVVTNVARTCDLTHCCYLWQLDMFKLLHLMFNVKYHALHTVQMHVGAISKLTVWFCVCTGGGDNSLKLVDYLPVQTHNKYNKLHVSWINMNFSLAIFMRFLLLKSN